MAGLSEIVLDKGVIKVPFSGPLTITRASPMALRHQTKTLGRHWLCPISDVEKILQWAGDNGVPVSQEVRDCPTPSWEESLERMALSTSPQVLPTEQVEIEGLTSTLLETQHVVTKAVTRCWLEVPGKKPHRGLIVADEPGLGKTLESLAAVRVEGLRCQRVVIVCPSSLTENWRQEMLEHFDLGTFHSWTAESQTPQPIPQDVDVVVIGWAILNEWAQTLADWKPDALIADEGHYAKGGAVRKKTTKKTQQKRDADGNLVRDEHGNLVIEEITESKQVSGSQRASAALTIAKSVIAQGGLSLVLTGTPIVNRPVELHALLELIGADVLFGNAKMYKERFCGPKDVPRGGGRTARSYEGATHLGELNARLASSGHYIRRTKEILVDAGLMQRKYVDAVYCYDRDTRPSPWIITPTAEEMATYREAEGETQTFFMERAAEHAEKMHQSITSRKVQDKVRAEGAKHLRQIAELRKAAALVKTKYVVEKVRQMNERGERVVIAAHHREVVDAYADAFSGLKIQGGMSVADIEQAKHLFNTSTVEEHPVMVLSVEAGKTGHTLCKQNINGVGPSCAYMVFAEQVWTPGDETQAQDRIWRIGQEREVRIINALLADSIDNRIYAQRQRKHQVVNAAIDAVRSEPVTSAGKDDREGAGQIALDLVAAGMRKGAA